jgi:hypothetical protein
MPGASSRRLGAWLKRAVSLTIGTLQVYTNNRRSVFAMRTLFSTPERWPRTFVDQGLGIAVTCEIPAHPSCATALQGRRLKSSNQ